MKRPITDVLRRGFDSAFANWPLVVLRIAENVLYGILIIGAVIAAVVPLLVSIGLSGFDAAKPEEAAATIASTLLEHLGVFVWIFAGALVLALVLLVIHSFVIAGCAQTFVDAERSGGDVGERLFADPGPAESRPHTLKVFSMERWLSGGRHSMWTVFWIYNITYGTTVAIVLVPAVITLAGMLAFHDSKPMVACIGCFGLVACVFLLILASVVAAIWSLKAVILAVERNLDASDATKVAWAEAKADFGRHFAVAFILFVISFGGAAAIGMFSVVFSVPSAHNAYMSLMFAPARIVISLLQSAFSAAVGMWMLASFAALSDRT